NKNNIATAQNSAVSDFQNFSISDNDEATKAILDFYKKIPQFQNIMETITTFQKLIIEIKQLGKQNNYEIAQEILNIFQKISQKFFNQEYNDLLLQINSALKNLLILKNPKNFNELTVEKIIAWEEELQNLLQAALDKKTIIKEEISYA